VGFAVRADRFRRRVADKTLSAIEPITAKVIVDARVNEGEWCGQATFSVVGRDSFHAVIVRW